MPEEKNECRTGMPCGLPKSGNACMNRTTACCLKCVWNPDEQVRRRALPLKKADPDHVLDPGIPGNAACLRADLSCREIQIQDKPDGLCR